MANKKCAQCGIKDRAKNRTVCHACRNRKYRKNNPMMAAFHAVKWSAKSRGINFDLSFDDFSAFAVKVDYIQNKGTTKSSMHIDRINPDPLKGYTKGNIQPLTNSQNAAKRWKVVRGEYNFELQRMEFWVSTETDNSDLSGVPF